MRLSRIQNSDLNIFDYDYDLTMMIFFLNPGGQVYARYGGRDAMGADARQSLAGLHYTMESVLAMHRRPEPQYAATRGTEPVFIIEFERAGRGRGCVHCHDVKETLNASIQSRGEWTREHLFRFPLPDNLGMKLEVDRGNIVESVTETSPSQRVGLVAGDKITKLNGIPVHSLGDATYALDRAPPTGEIPLEWSHGDELRSGSIAVSPDWKRSELSWRPSMREFMPNIRLLGDDLTEDEKRQLGLPLDRLAFTQREPYGPEGADVHAGDVVFGVNGETFNLRALQLRWILAGKFVVGDRITINLLRDGKRLDLEMELTR